MSQDLEDQKFNKSAPQSLFSVKQPKKNLSSKTSMKQLLNEAKQDSAIIKIQSLLRYWKIRKIHKIRMKYNIKRKKVANEILTTEIDYLKNLQCLSMEFLKPIISKQNHKLLGDLLARELTLSLSGVDVILAFHNTTIEEFQKKTNPWNYYSCFGKTFEQMGLFLKSYSQYVNHYQQVVQLLAKRKQDKAFQVLLGELKQQSTGKSLQDYMIMPVQRIPRYAMLLGELIQCTELDHPDYNDLLKCHEKMVHTANHIENESAEAQSISKVLELANSFIYNGEAFKLVSPSRRYIIESDSLSALPNNHSLQENCKVFLFNDLIIWSKKKKEKLNILHMIVPTDITKVLTIEDDGKTIGSIELYINSEKISMIISKTPELWITKLNLTISGAKAWYLHQENESNDHRSITIPTKTNSEDATERKAIKKKSLQDLFKPRDTPLKSSSANMINQERSGSPLHAEEKRVNRLSLVHSDDNLDGNDERKNLKFALEKCFAEYLPPQCDDDSKPALNRSKSVDGKNMFNLQNSNVKMIRKVKESPNESNNNNNNGSTPKRHKRENSAGTAYTLDIAKERDHQLGKSPKKLEKGTKKESAVFQMLKTLGDLSSYLENESDDDEMKIKPARKSMSNNPRSSSSSSSSSTKSKKEKKSRLNKSKNNTPMASRSNSTHATPTTGRKKRIQSKYQIKVSIDDEFEKNPNKSELDLLKEIIAEHQRRSALAESGSVNLDSPTNSSTGNLIEQLPSPAIENNEKVENNALKRSGRFKSKIQIKVTLDDPLFQEKKSDIEILKEVIEEHNRQCANEANNETNNDHNNNNNDNENDDDNNNQENDPQMKEKQRNKVDREIEALNLPPVQRKRSRDVYFTIEETSSETLQDESINNNNNSNSNNNNDTIDASPIVPKKKSKIKLQVSLDEINSIKGKNDLELLREIIAEHNRITREAEIEHSNNNSNNNSNNTTHSNVTTNNSSNDLSDDSNEDENTNGTSEDEENNAKIEMNENANSINHQSGEQTADFDSPKVTSNAASDITPTLKSKRSKIVEKPTRSLFSVNKIEKLPIRKNGSNSDLSFTPSTPLSSTLNLSSPLQHRIKVKKFKSEDDNLFNLLSPRYPNSRVMMGDDDDEENVEFDRKNFASIQVQKNTSNKLEKTVNYSNHKGGGEES